MAIDADLLDILVCPEDKGTLYYFEKEGFLYNPRLARTYPINDNIPVLLVTSAETVTDTAALDARVAAGEARPTHQG